MIALNLAQECRRVLYAISSQLWRGCCCGAQCISGFLIPFLARGTFSMPRMDLCESMKKLRSCKVIGLIWADFCAFHQRDRSSTYSGCRFIMRSFFLRKTPFSLEHTLHFYLSQSPRSRPHAKHGLVLVSFPGNVWPLPRIFHPGISAQRILLRHSFILSAQVFTRWCSYEIPVTFDFANILLLINCTNFAFSIFRNDPVFLFYTLSSVIAIFKSYPTFGDFSIPFALLISWSHLYPCTFLFSRLHCLTRYLIETFAEMKDITY